MKLTLTRGELKEAAAGFQKIVTGRPNLAVLAHVRFSASGDSLTAEATDLDQTAIYRFDNAGVNGEGDILVPFTLLKELTRGGGAEVVTFENAGTALTITSDAGGRAVRRTAEGADPADWPASGPAIPTAEAAGFLAAYRRTAPFASKDETRRVLQGVFIDASGAGDRNATLVATDGRRLTCCNSLKLHLGDRDGVIVPVTRFLLWGGLPAEARLGVSGGRDGARVCVQAGRWTYRVKAVDGVYPNWRQVIPGADGMPHRITFADADALAMGRIVPALPGGGVVLEGSADGRLTLTATERGGGKTLSVPLTAGTAYAGAGCAAHVDGGFLMDALNAGFRNFLFADASPLLSDDGDGAKHVLMPLLLNKAAPADAGAAQAGAATPAQKPKIAPATGPEKPKEDHEMTTETKTETREPAALERLQAAYETAKGKVREAQSALADVASAIRDAAREDRQRRAEVETVRAGLQKLQAIRV